MPKSATEDKMAKTFAAIVPDDRLFQPVMAWSNNAASDASAVWLVSTIEDAESLLFQIQNVAVVCVDPPRSELCSNFAQAAAFFNREEGQ
jgi:hypothetical protein